jgi:NTP pyrophosphatase (non-canonical NTP hydrolase)
MDLNEQIKKIIDIRKAMWPVTYDMDEVDHLVATIAEELGELRGEIRSFLGRPYSPEKKSSENLITEELGDVLVPIIALANYMDITLSEALRAAIDKLQKRLDKFNKDNGVVEKIKPLKFQNDHQPFKYDIGDAINLDGARWECTGRSAEGVTMDGTLYTI